MKLQSIKKIDFTPFAVDPRTNSIMGKASEDELKLVEDALKRIDRPGEKQGEAAPSRRMWPRRSDEGHGRAGGGHDMLGGSGVNRP